MGCRVGIMIFSGRGFKRGIVSLGLVGAMSVMAGGLFSTTAFAKMRVYQAEYQHNADRPLDTLEVEGVKMQAELKALAECKESTSKECEIRPTAVQTLNTSTLQISDSGEKSLAMTTKVESVVHGTTPLIKRGSSFLGMSTWTTKENHSELELLGIQHDALTKALSQCYKEFAHCSAGTINVSMKNQLSKTKKLKRSRAEAQVYGFNTVGE